MKKILCVLIGLSAFLASVAMAGDLAKPFASIQEIQVFLAKARNEGRMNTSDDVDTFVTNVMEYSVKESEKLESFYPALEKLYNDFDKVRKDGSGKTAKVWLKAIAGITFDNDRHPEFVFQIAQAVNDIKYNEYTLVLSPLETNINDALAIIVDVTRINRVPAGYKILRMGVYTVVERVQ